MDALDLLARHDHRVTRRADGPYDVTMYGRGVTLEKVMNLWVALQTWPRWVPRIGRPVRPDQWWDGRRSDGAAPGLPCRQPSGTPASFAIPRCGDPPPTIEGARGPERRASGE